MQKRKTYPPVTLALLGRQPPLGKGAIGGRAQGPPLRGYVRLRRRGGACPRPLVGRATVSAGGHKARPYGEAGETAGDRKGRPYGDGGTDCHVSDVGHSLQVLGDEGAVELVRAFGRLAMTRRWENGLPRQTPPVSGTPTAPVCALGHLPRRGRQGTRNRHARLEQFLHSFISTAASFLHSSGANLALAFIPTLWYDASARKRAHN
jgi:hypothetical protein